MISARGSSDDRVAKRLKNMSTKALFSEVPQHAEAGVKALAEVTPVRTGKTQRSWDYKIKKTRRSVTIIWTNDNVNFGEVIALLIQYGHGTGNGGYIPGHDYINPVMRGVFSAIKGSVRGR